MNGRNKEILLISILMLVAIYPDLVLAGFSFTSSGGDSISGVFDKIADILKGKLAKSVALVALLGCGYAAFAGILTWRPLVYIALGIGIVFGGNDIVNLLAGG